MYYTTKHINNGSKFNKINLPTSLFLLTHTPSITPPAHINERINRRKENKNNLRQKLFARFFQKKKGVICCIHTVHNHFSNPFPLRARLLSSRLLARMGLIFITVGERSVACGKRTNPQKLPERQNKNKISPAFQAEFRLSFVPQATLRLPTVMKIRLFKPKNSKTKNPCKSALSAKNRNADDADNTDVRRFFILERKDTKTRSRKVSKKQNLSVFATSPLRVPKNKTKKNPRVIRVIRVICVPQIKQSNNNKYKLI